MQNSSETILNRTRYLPACSAVTKMGSKIKDQIKSDENCIYRFHCQVNVLAEIRKVAVLIPLI
jgi:hypothetical protein